MLDQLVVLGKVLHDRRLDVVSAAQVPVLDVLAAGHLASIALGDLDVLVEVLPGLAGDQRPHDRVVLPRVGHLERLDVFTSMLHELLVDLLVHVSRESAEHFWPQYVYARP